MEHLIPQFVLTPKHWPPQPLHQVLAVAQHHGVPTCLLDWTQRGHVAAYFAASSALSLPIPPSHLAVWALDTYERNNWKDFGLVQLPGGTSSNLAAQRGLFTISRIRQESSDTFIPVPLNEHNPYSSGVSLIKYTLPFSEAIPLLEGCHRLGVSGSTLFPGYEGVAKEVQDLANMGKRDFDSSIISAREL
ncbi:FRG domain protein [compost metagenome]